MTKIREQKLRLLAEHPFCFYCGKKVRDYTGDNPPPGDAATIEHLSYKRKGEPRPALGRRVLSCYDCNSTLGTIWSQWQDKLGGDPGPLTGTIGEIATIRKKSHGEDHS